MLYSAAIWHKEFIALRAVHSSRLTFSLTTVAFNETNSRQKQYGLLAGVLQSFFNKLKIKGRIRNHAQIIDSTSILPSAMNLRRN